MSLPTKKIFSLIVWLLYLISPIDALPDIFGPTGFIDDLAALAVLIWYLSKKAKETTHKIPSQTSSTQNAEEHKEIKILSPYEVLGVSRNASKEEIDKAYRSKLKEYHPDKVHSLGGELQKLAKEKTREIVEAYEKLS